MKTTEVKKCSEVLLNYCPLRITDCKLLRLPERSGPNTSYLWLLSRTPAVDEDILYQFIKKVKNLGFKTEKLIYVNQE